MAGGRVKGAFHPSGEHKFFEISLDQDEKDIPMTNKVIIPVKWIVEQFFLGVLTPDYPGVQDVLLMHGTNDEKKATSSLSWKILAEIFDELLSVKEDNESILDFFERYPDMILFNFQHGVSIWDIAVKDDVRFVSPVYQTFICRNKDGMKIRCKFPINGLYSFDDSNTMRIMNNSDLVYRRQMDYWNTFNRISESTKGRRHLYDVDYRNLQLRKYNVESMRRDKHNEVVNSNPKGSGIVRTQFEDAALRNPFGYQAKVLNNEKRDKAFRERNSHKEN